MKVWMIGGTGLLGSQAATQLIARGHEVSTIALPPIPQGASLPKEMEIRLGNYMELSDEEISASMQGCEGFVFVAGIDERIEASPPIYDLFHKYNNVPLERLLTIAKGVGIKHAVICGSYFSYFAKERPELDLRRWHPYIRSRLVQEEIALSFADDDFDVSVLELPYIFGTQPGRKPVWVFFVEMLRNMKGRTYFPKGGTTMVTVKQVGQAIAGALERSKGGKAWPIGWYNMNWKEFLPIVHTAMGVPDRKIFFIPKWLFSLYGNNKMKKDQKRGIEGGLHLGKFAQLQCSELFIDKSLGCVPLGVEEDDIVDAIQDSVRLSVSILDGKTTNAVDMKGE